MSIVANRWISCEREFAKSLESAGSPNACRLMTWPLRE